MKTGKLLGGITSILLCVLIPLAVFGEGSFRQIEENGKIIESVWEDSEGQADNGPEGYASIRYTYKANNTYEAYYDTEGKPCVCADGYAGYRDTRDADGATVKRTFLGTDGNPAETHDGYSEIRYEYDATKQLSSTRYYDLNGTEVPGK